MCKHVLIATDGSELATKALEHGLALAKRDNAQITVVTVTESWSPLDVARSAVRPPRSGWPFRRNRSYRSKTRPRRRYSTCARSNMQCPPCEGSASR
jgi:nucleotide-binding universal stress UspA family protein